MAKRKTTPNRTASYLVRVTPDERDELHALAAQAGTDLSEAMREGAREYLRARTDQAPDDELLAEARALAARIDSRFRRRKE